MEGNFMKTAIILKYQDINRVILLPEVSPDQLFMISSSLTDYQKSSFQLLSEADIRNKLEEIGLADVEIFKIAAEIN